MKRSEIIFGALQVPVDYFMIVLAALTAFAIRDIPQILAVKEKLYNFPFQSYLEIVLLVAPFFILVYAIEGLYRMRVTRKFWQEAFAVFKATSLVLIMVIVAIFLKREWFSSRFIILAGWMLAVVYVVFARYPVSYTHLRAHETVLDLVCRLLLEKKKNTIITDSKYTSNLTQTIGLSTINSITATNITAQ